MVSLILPVTVSQKLMITQAPWAYGSITWALFLLSAESG